MGKIHNDLKYKSFGIKLSEEVKEEFKKKRLASGLTCNMFMKKLLSLIDK